MKLERDVKENGSKILGTFIFGTFILGTLFSLLMTALGYIIYNIYIKSKKRDEVPAEADEDKIEYERTKKKM